jgi:tetratricopeptide (TPR) repeat protein
MNFKNITSSRILLSAVVFLVAFIVYIPALTGGFVWDNINQITTLSGNIYSPASEAKYYRPLFDISMFLDEQLWGVKPAGFHLTNILLHSICSVLVFFLGIYLLENTGASFFSALLFALHPIHTEAVAWVSARAELLQTVFFIPAFILYLHYRKSGRTLVIILSGLLFLLSVLSKQNALSFIGILLIYEAVGGFNKNRLLRAVCAYIIVVVVYYLFPHDTDKALSLSDLYPQSFYSLFVSFGYSMQKLAVPFNLNMMPYISDSPFYFIFSLIPLVIGGVLYSEGKRLEGFLTAWIILTLILSLLATLSTGGVIGERFLYLPSAGFCLLIGAVLKRIKNPKILFACLMPVFIIYGIGTYNRTVVWKDEIAIWKDTAEKNPDFALAHLNYGAVLLKKGIKEKGKEELLKALKQRNLTTEEILSVMLLFASAGAETPEVAEKEILNVIKTAKGEAAAYYNLGLMYYDLFNSAKSKKTKKKLFLNKAIGYFEKAIENTRNFLLPHYYLGICYLRQQKWEKAEIHLKTARKLDIEGEYKEELADFLKLIEIIKSQK